MELYILSHFGNTSLHLANRCLWITRPATLNSAQNPKKKYDTCNCINWNKKATIWKLKWKLFIITKYETLWCTDFQRLIQVCVDEAVVLKPVCSLCAVFSFCFIGTFLIKGFFYPSVFGHWTWLHDLNIMHDFLASFSPDCFKLMWEKWEAIKYSFFISQTYSQYTMKRVGWSWLICMNYFFLDKYLHINILGTFQISNQYKIYGCFGYFCFMLIKSL